MNQSLTGELFTTGNTTKDVGILAMSYMTYQIGKHSETTEMLLGSLPTCQTAKLLYYYFYHFSDSEQPMQDFRY